MNRDSLASEEKIFIENIESLAELKNNDHLMMYNNEMVAQTSLLINESYNGTRDNNNNNNNNSDNHHNHYEKVNFPDDKTTNHHAKMNGIDSKKHLDVNDHTTTLSNAEMSLFNQRLSNGNFNFADVNDTISEDAVLSSHPANHHQTTSAGSKTATTLCNNHATVTGIIENDDQSPSINAKFNLNSVTVDSSKDYSSSSDELDNVTSTSAADSSPNQQPTASKKASIKSMYQNKNKNYSLSIDEQSGVVMIAPIVTTSANENGKNTPDENKTDQAAVEQKQQEQQQPKQIKSISHADIDLSIFELIDKTSKKFIVKPATIGMQIKCQIYRQKGMYPEYKFYLENLDGNLLLLMSARKKKKTKTTCYIINFINFDLNNLENYTETPIAKLKSNLFGTNFSLYDLGPKPISSNVKTSVVTHSPASPTSDSSVMFTQKSSNLDLASDMSDETNMINSSNSSIMNRVSTDNETSVMVDETLQARKEYVSVSYEINVLGVKGPRQMSIILPGMDEKFNREDFVQTNVSDTLANAWKKIETNLRHQKSLKECQGAQSTVSLSHGSSQQNLKSSSASKLSSLKRTLFRATSIDYGATSTSTPSPTSPQAKTPTTTTSTTTTGASNLKKNSLKNSFDESINKITASTQTIQRDESSTGMGSTLNGAFKNVVKLINKSPEWHKELHSFALNFNGRVTQASVKNFQIVHEINTNYIVMQFGKVSKDLYTCDFSYPMCALQAFAVAITSLDNKLGCD